MSIKALTAELKMDTDAAKAAIDDFHTHLVKSFDSQAQYAQAINNLMVKGFLTQAEGTKILDKLAAGETHLEKALISRMGLAKMTGRIFEAATKRWTASEVAGIRQIGVEAEITQRKLIGMSAAKSSSPPASGGGAAGGGGGGVNFVRVAATAGQLAVLGKVSSTMRTVGSSMQSVSKTSTIAATSMERFRMGLAAPKVNPEMNVIKKGIEKVGDAAAAGVNKIREAADALASDLPGTVGAAAKGLGKVGVELDKSSQTMSKHVSQMQSSSKGLTLLGKVFPFMRSQIQSVQAPFDKLRGVAEHAADKLDDANSKVAKQANELRRAQFIMDGTWQSLGGSADMFSRAIYHANLPVRLMKREWEGATRVVRAATHVFNFVTHPVHAVGLAVVRSSAQFREFRAQLPQLERSTNGLGSRMAALAQRAIGAIPGVQRLSSVTASASAKFTTAKAAVGSFVTSGINRAMTAISPFTAKLSAAASRVTSFVGSLQLGTRAFRMFAHATYFTGPAFTMAGKAISGTAKAISWLLTPAKSATTSILKLTGVQNTFIGRALGMKKAAEDAGAGMMKMEQGSSKLSKGLGMLGSGAGMAKTAAAGLIAGMLALGTSTAMATEKNNAVFGTMLHDMVQGKAVVASLQKTTAAKFFDNQELLDSGRLLFKAGVSAADLAGKTNQFAKIAAATSTEIGDLARIYQQGANAGSFGQDKINQYAERGIAIYDGLRFATGKSGAELQKMISDGKIGTAEMDAALAHLTEGHGIYADSLTNLGNTTAGKWSTIKNTVTQALGGMMGVALEILAPFGTALVMLTEQTVAAFESFKPQIMYAAVAGAWFFGNIVDLGRFAWATMSLYAVTAFNDIIYFFTDKIPAYLDWFSANWKQVFWDAGNLIVTVFANIGKNIGSAMTAIWDFIASGGTAELKFAFVPLLDGFKATVSELPNIPDRAMTELEKSLQAQTEGLGMQLGDNFDSMLKDAEQKMSKQAPELSNTAGKAAAGAASETNTAAKNASKKMAENKAAQINSAEGQSVVAQMLKGLKGDDDKSAKKAAIKSEKHLEKLARNSDRGKPLAAREWKA